jgi:hypothetical protein
MVPHSNRFSEEQRLRLLDDIIEYMLSHPDETPVKNGVVKDICPFEGHLRPLPKPGKGLDSD